MQNASKSSSLCWHTNPESILKISLVPHNLGLPWTSFILLETMNSSSEWRQAQTNKPIFELVKYDQHHTEIKYDKGTNLTHMISTGSNENVEFYFKVFVTSHRFTICRFKLYIQIGEEIRTQSYAFGVCQSDRLEKSIAKCCYHFSNLFPEYNINALSKSQVQSLLNSLDQCRRYESMLDVVKKSQYCKKDLPNEFFGEFFDTITDPSQCNQVGIPLLSLENLKIANEYNENWKMFERAVQDLDTKMQE